MEEILSSGGVSLLKNISLFVGNKHSGLIWHTLTLMAVNGNGISSLGTSKQVLSVLIRPSKETSPTSVNMMPLTVLLANISDFVLFIE